MKWNSITTCAVIIASFSVFWTCVFARHTRFTCDGGRGEGDKWFDGCRWCVCQEDGPMCSPASCSDLVARVAPCENVGSRWKDGCYQCKCHVHGIDCVADSICVALGQRVREEFESCVEPEDDRCVCGIDGTPSCTAEVIDRNAHPATTVALDISHNPPKRLDNEKPDFGYSNPNEDNWGVRRRVKRQTLSQLLSKNWRSFLHRKLDRRNRRRSSYFRSPRSYKGRGGFLKRVADMEERYPIRGYHGNHNKGSHGKLVKTHRKGASSTRRGDERRHGFDGYRQSDMANDEARELQAPRSLLIITSNRCRYGARWYGGSLRCYCDENGSITCGEPKFVATRIDGFRLEKMECEEGHEWIDEDKCRVCDCKVNGAALCRRSESCPLPFLIQPVDDIDSPREHDLDSSNEAGSSELDSISPSISRKAIDRRSGLSSFSHLPLDSDHVDKPFLPPSRGTGNHDDSEEIVDLDYEVTSKPKIIVDGERLRRLLRNRHAKDGPKRHTTVIVRECNPLSRWLEGCKRCSCDTLGRKNCDESRCLKPGIPVFNHFNSHGTSKPYDGKGRPFQLPPPGPVRIKPVEIKSPFPEKNPCGRYKVRERYYVDCNQCVCTSHGPKCTMINCSKGK